MKKIKLQKEVVDLLRNNDLLLSGVKTLLKEYSIASKNCWERIQKQYPKLNFDNAGIDAERGILILPFENYKDDGIVKE